MRSAFLTSLAVATLLLTAFAVSIAHLRHIQAMWGEHSSDVVSRYAEIVMIGGPR